MSFSTPLQSFLGGLVMPLPIHALMVLNGNAFGISSFVHRAIKGNVEAAMGVAGLVLGGGAVALIEGHGPDISILMTMSHLQILVAGLLVGIGTKLANGCTSGHMLCGISRFSVRSMVATMTFAVTGIITAQFAHSELPATSAAHWSLDESGAKLLILQTVPIAVTVGLFFLGPNLHVATSLGKNRTSPAPSPPHISSTASFGITSVNTAPSPPAFFLRRLALFATSFSFALALRLSNLTNPRHLLAFLMLPLHPAFDPSLACLAAGALPLCMLLYHFARGCEVPRLGGKWGITKGGQVDKRLVGGAAMFGVGWGLAGICPGAGVVNLGRALVSGEGLTIAVEGVGSVVVGGLLGDLVIE